MKSKQDDWHRLKNQNSAGDPKLKDDVNHPSHYNHGKIECIDYLKDNLGDGYEYYLEGNIKKYLHRWRYKGANRSEKVEDLRKAAWYLGRLLETQLFE